MSQTAAWKQLAAAKADPSARLASLESFALLLRAEPALLNEFAQPLLALQAEPCAVTRRWLAGTLPEVVTWSPTLLPACLAVAAALVRDPSAAVAKQALLAAVALFRAAFVWASREVAGSARPELHAGWTAARALCASACLLVRAEHTGVRLQALKFLEAAVLMFTAALGANADESGVAAGVSPLHPGSFLTPPELNRDLRTYLDELQACVSRRHPGPFAVVLVASLGSLARLRAPLCAEMVPPLLQTAAHAAEALPSAQAASLVHALKQAFVHLLRCGHAGMGEWQDRVVGALEALGHAEAATSALRQVERLAKRERAQAEREAEAELDEDTSLFPAVKRARTEPPSAHFDGPPLTDPALLRQVVAALGALSASGDLAMLHSLVAQLAPAVLVDVVLENLRYLTPSPAADPRFGSAQAPAPGLMDLFSSPPPAAASGPAPDVDVQMAQAPEVVQAPPPLVAVQLSGEQRTAQRHSALSRILRAEEHSLASAAGGKELRRLLLARVVSSESSSFGNEFLDFLLEHYEAREGHEHILQWLHCLHVASLADGATRKRAYDSALLDAAHKMLEKLSARDRALPLLLIEAPTLPAAAMDVLEWLCGLAERVDVPPADIEQRTLGLIALRDIIMNRPQERDVCLALVLRCTVHADDALRSKAIRMVVNQLHPLPYCAQQIDSFAAERLQSTRELTAEPEGEGGTAESEAVRCISLFFALCTREPALVSQIFAAFAASPGPVQAAFHRNMAGLARTLGVEAKALLEAIQAPPGGAEVLALQAFQALCDANETVSAALLAVGRAAYAHTDKDVRFLLPCLHLIPRDELRTLLPLIVALPCGNMASALRRIAEVKPGVPPAMSASELVVALHSIEPSKDGVPMRKVIEACSLIFTPPLRDVFTPDALAVALQQLVEQQPIPLLFMRTVIQTASVAPKLHGFILDLLSRLVLKQVWKTDAKLWEGVLRCAKQMVPRSFSVYLQLPAAQLKEALAQSLDLVAPLSAYAATPTVRSSVPGATLNVLAEAAAPPPTDE